jgi:glutamate decarboxylase
MAKPSAFTLPAPREPESRREPDVRNLFGPASGSCHGEDAGLAEAVRRVLDGRNAATAASDRSPAVPYWSVPEGHFDPARYYEALACNVLPRAVNTASPQCMAHMTALVPDFVHELTHVLLALNQNVIKREASNSFTDLERETIAMLHHLAFERTPEFYDQHAQAAACVLGMFCSGGTLANLTALWIARNRLLGEVERLGMPAALERSGYKGLAIVGSKLMHYSLRKTAAILGIGEDNIRFVDVDARGCVQAQACRSAMQQCKESGIAVVALVGIAGSTDYGSLDPLDELADLAKEFGVHYHVDGAWGGGLLFSRTHRARLRGIERAASVTIDGHKYMYLPIGTSLLLLRDPHAADVIARSSDYIIQDGSGDLGRHSIEGSRPSSSLFAHAALHIIGRRGYETLIDGSVARASSMAEEIRRRQHFELLADPDTSVVLYRYVPELARASRTRGWLTHASQEPINRFNMELQRAEWEASRTAVSRTIVRHRAYADPIVALRAVMANPLSTDADIRALLDDQERIAESLQQRTV